MALDKRMSFNFKCVILMVMASCVALNDAAKPNMVVIRNNLKSNKNLKVHCRSRDDDLGYHVVRILDVYEFSFEDNLFQTTLFWCNLWQGPNYKHHQVFEAYKAKFLRRNDQLYFWDAREDGIYFTNNIDAVAQFKYAWDVPHK